jgi:hypothetical protein
MKKIFLVLLAAAGFLHSLAAMEWTSFPGPVQKGGFLLSSSFGFGTYISGSSKHHENSPAFTGIISVDYALPVNFPLTLGFETGYLWSNPTIDLLPGMTLQFTDVYPHYVPFTARLAWHPNWRIKKLDTYIVGKAGFGLLLWTGNTSIEGNRWFDYENGYGHILGIDIGCRYFITDRIGLYVEGGYERCYSFYKITWWHPTVTPPSWHRLFFQIRYRGDNVLFIMANSGLDLGEAYTV